MKYTPRPYQNLIVDHQLEIQRGGVFAGMGMGKTVATLTALMADAFRDPAPTLVLAPLRVAKSVWPAEARKWDHLAGFDVVPVVGSREARIAALKREAPVYAINYENLGWLYEHQKDIGTWPFKRIISDESTRLKSFRGSVQTSKTGKIFLRKGGGQRASVLAQAAWGRTKGWCNLTGTPTPNGLRDLWGQTWFLDQGRSLGRTFEGFHSRWFYTDQYSGEVHMRPHADRQIHNAVRHLYLSLEPKDWFDLREPIVREIRVQLPEAARKLYRKMEREMFVSIQGENVTATMQATKTLKCLQMANGAAYVDDQGADDGPERKFVEVHDEKLQALESIVEEAAGMPVLVAYQFRSDLARIQRAFPKARHLDDDPRTLDEWNAGRIPLLLAHPASAGHGLNLQDGGNILVVFGHWWDLEQYQQILERIGPVRQLQAGHDRPVWIYLIIADDTIDEDVVARRASKASVQDSLLAAMKRRNASTEGAA